ncbi:MAG: diaminopimelate decarboxylase, partial [Gammaproteobacteria bacterium]|nr:diaminopimelate decarboxylase [Gammaproteobacteria bacterium]
RAFDEAFGRYPHLICYSVKANSNLAVLNLLARLGSGFDIVSAGELERVMRAGGDPGKTVFSGVGKTRAEIRQALEAGIRCVDVESLEELERVNQVAGELDQQAQVSIRVNPDIDAKTHPYIATGLHDAKFGVDMDTARSAYQAGAKMGNVLVTGIATHIGSQIVTNDPFVEALERLLRLVEDLEEQHIVIEHIDIGGGLGIRYQDETPPEVASYVQALIDAMRGRGFELPIIVEPGRAIVGGAGVLLTRIEYLKRTAAKCFAIVDAGMNDFLRPALYDAWQDIVAVTTQPDLLTIEVDVVGPVCENTDVLGRNRRLAIAEGDLLAIRDAGAYGSVMSSNYNSRPRPAEVMVDGDEYYLIRHRETIDELCSAESILPA